MKKLSLLAATCVLSLWGCAHGSNVDDEAQADKPPMQQAEDDDKQAREAREGAPTVYDGDATGGSGNNTTVTTPDGQKWDVQQEPRFPGGETPPETDDTNAASGKDGKVKANSEVIDEGPTDDASQK